jgi:Immunity protein 26
MDSPPIVRLGFLKIFLPDASRSTFWFMVDLVPHLAVGYQHEASAKLAEAWRTAARPPGRCSIDHEADYTFVHAAKPEVIVRVAAIVHELAGAALDDSACAHALNQLRAWRRPRRHAWKVGDIFSLPLSDESIAYGQIVGVHLTKSPTTLLFEYRHAGPPLSLEDIVALPIITILHTDGFHLASGRWKVLGNAAPTLDPHVGPWGESGTSTSDSHIEYLADAWYGLIPWNVLATDDWLDKELLPGRGRPATALVLSPEEREAYRKQKGWTRRLEGAG